MEHFCVALAPVLTPSLCVLRCVTRGAAVLESPRRAFFRHRPGGGMTAVLVFIAVSFANSESDSKSTIKKISSCAIDSVQL